MRSIFASTTTCAVTALLLLLQSSNLFCHGFAITTKTMAKIGSSPVSCCAKRTYQDDEDEKTLSSASQERRQFLRTAFLTVTTASLGTAGLSSQPQPAQATYSAYTHREQDWNERLEKGDVQISNAKALRKQLRDIVPQNSSSSRVFCPNGPSAAVSPLMENKCDDERMALPSVYGRTEDIVGNSVPGFKGGYYSAATAGVGSLSAGEVGGFPAYGSPVPQSKR